MYSKVLYILITPVHILRCGVFVIPGEHML